MASKLSSSDGDTEEDKIIDISEMNERDMKKHRRYMNMALRQAEEALKVGEVPVGCVIVRNDRLLSSGHNRTNLESNVRIHLYLVDSCRRLRRRKIQTHFDIASTSRLRDIAN